MNVALISDIHGNIHGLKTVLADFYKIDKILCAGDITGYYPFVNEVIEELKKKNIISVRGNHDQYLIDGRVPEDKNENIKNSVVRMKQIISKENLDYIKSLPETLDLYIDNKRALVFHGSPWDHFEERIYPDYKDFDKFLEIDADVVILGNTHYSFIKKVGRVIVINPGSCGQPRDYNLLSYTMWDTKDNTFKNRRIDWNIEEFIKEASRFGIDKKLFEVFNRRKK